MLNHLLIQEGATHPLTRADLPPTRKVPTPHRTTLYYATAASHPPEYASHPTSERGRSLFREANLYAHPAHVWVNVCTARRCARVRGREFRNEGRIYGLAGLDFSPRVLFRPSFKATRTSFRFPRGNSFPKFRRGKSSFLPRLASPTPATAVRCG